MSNDRQEVYVTDVSTCTLQNRSVSETAKERDLDKGESLHELGI